LINRALKRAGMSIKSEFERDFVDSLDEAFERAIEREKIKGRPRGIHYDAFIAVLQAEITYYLYNS
jgi:hypothetical protein